jgi:hypothetical protein
MIKGLVATSDRNAAIKPLIVGGRDRGMATR